MANERRVRFNSIGGLIEDNPLTSGATTLTSAALAAMGVVDTTNYAVVVLDPDGIEGTPEIAYVTAHVSAATSATLLRGQEGTAALAHSQDVPWAHAGTIRDFPPTLDYPWAGDTLSGGPFDEEFERDSSPTSLPSAFSWVNQGSTTYVEEYGAGHLSVPAAVGSNFRGIFKTLPTATTYAITTKCGIAYSHNNYVSPCPLVLRESATGKLYSLGLNSSRNMVTMTWASVSSGATTITQWNCGFAPLYWRIAKASATSWSFACSQDGVAWFTLASAVNVNTFFTTAPDQVGIGGESNNQSVAAPFDMATHWMRFR